MFMTRRPNNTNCEMIFIEAFTCLSLLLLASDALLVKLCRGISFPWVLVFELAIGDVYISGNHLCISVVWSVNL